MNATKRKFNALLQGLSSPRPSKPDPDSNDSTNMSPRRYVSGVASQDEILQKRRRLGFPESTAPTLFSTLPVTTSLSNVVLKRPAAHLGHRTTRHASSRYCPGDRDELLRRLSTFQEITQWTPKPDRINEVEWAKRGWICQGKEKVRCVLCHKELLVKLERKEDDCAGVSEVVSSEIAEALIDKYSDLVISSHQEDCLWRKRGCDDSLMRLSFSNTQTTLASLRQRYDELCARGPFLPYEFNIRLPDHVSIDEVLSQLPADFFTTPPLAVDQPGSVATEKTPNRAAFALALMGWQGLTNPRIGAVPNSASCHTCLRRLGLWMFKSREVDEQGHVVVPAPMHHLDPVREHRFFCPWRNAHAQSRSGLTSKEQPPSTAWRSLVQTIKNESDVRNVCSGKPRRVGQLRGEEVGSPSRSKGTPGSPGSPAPASPVTPKKSTAVTPVASPQESANGEEEEENDEKVRDAKDKERWARLRKVKSLFDTKGSKRFRLEMGRPGTGHSNKSPSGK